KKDLIPFENGKYVSNLTSTLQGGYIVSYKSGDLWIAKFMYRTKKLVYNGYNDRCDYNDRWMYISYEELREFEREMNINEALGIETKLISYYPPKLEKPFEVKVGDILRCGKFAKIIVTRVTPRTFTYNY